LKKRIKKIIKRAGVEAIFDVRVTGGGWQPSGKFHRLKKRDLVLREETGISVGSNKIYRYHHIPLKKIRAISWGGVWL